MSTPRITVCVTTCNQRSYIRRCLESAISQEVDAEMEILVGDDCSDDGTSEIVAEIAAAHPGLVTHFRHSPRVGASANTQILLSHAVGNFIAKLDGDDYWLPGKLTIQLEYLDKNPDCVAVYSNALTVNEMGETVGIFNDVGDVTFDLSKLLRRGNVLNNSSILLRSYLKDDWLRLQGPLLDFRVHLLHATKGPIGHIGRPLVVYRIASKGSMVAHADDMVRALYWQAILSVPRELVSDKDFACGISDFYRRILFRCVRTSRITLAREWWPKVRQTSPYGTIWTIWLVFTACARMACKEIAGLINTGSKPPRPRVMYRH